jgi:8-oxo-dGTP pyrophosphatase MutT (NUDIX family)
MPGARWIPQAAAIPVRDGAVCLITSSGGGRWVVPKGIIDPGMSAPETALQEAWEEAGLRGTLDPEPVGTYRYDKWGGTCHVTVFLMRVTEIDDDWPERAVRRRSWLSFREAVARIQRADLREVVRRALRGLGGTP